MNSQNGNTNMNMNMNMNTNMNNGINNSKVNGRVDILNPPDIAQLFSMYDKIPANQCTTFRNATIGQWDETPLSTAYFSKENIQILQNGIRAGVYNMSNGQYVIGPQDCDNLKIIMRAIFLQYSANLPQNIAGQIQQLNQMVLDHSIPKVYGEAQGYIKYLHDASTLVVPLAAPVCDTQFDKRNYKMPKWF
jgi:hypothetical protein